MGGGSASPPPAPAPLPTVPEVDLAELAKQRRDLDAKRRGSSAFRIDPISTGLSIGSNTTATPTKSSGTGLMIQ